MDDFISQYQYHVAWTIYLASGSVFSLACWRLTDRMRHTGWRDLIRGVVLVLIYTPWYVSEAREYVAPAAMVAAMDLLVGGTDNGLAGSVAILCAMAAMLTFLIGKRVIRRNQNN